MIEMQLKKPWIQTRAAMSIALLEGTLHAVFKEHRPADQYLKRIFRSDRRIGGRDRRLYADLIFAVFRWYGPLHRHSSLPAFCLAGAAAAEKIDDPVCGIFLKAAGLEEARQNELFEPESAEERLNAFFRLARISEPVAMEECLPEWVFSHLDFTPDKDFFHLQQKRSPLWLRVQNRNVEGVVESLRQEGIQAEAPSRIENALRIPEAKVNLAELDAYKHGWIEVQDLSSQCIGQICAPQPGQYWWDACAGGGGKSLQLAALMHGQGTILASDIRGRKLHELKRRAGLAGFSIIRTREWDGVHRPVEENSCDGVLIDAPCSSSGRWRRNPESRWLLTEKRVAELAAIQKKLLSSASKAVKPGGFLIFATCSLLCSENRLNVESFLAAHPEFTLEKFPHPLTGETMPGYVQILPQDGDCDASFTARFRRRE